MKKKKKDGPSFAFLCKEEVSSRPFEDDEIRPFLSAFCRQNGSYRISQGNPELDFSCESAKLAKLLYDLGKRRYGVSARFAYSKSMGFYKRTKYHVLFPNPEEMMQDLEVDFLEHVKPNECVKSMGQYPAFLMGAFCASGSVNDPTSSNYHLEISHYDEREAKWLYHIFQKANGGQFHPKMIKRRNQNVIYLKRAEEISDFLIAMGATQCCLKFEDIRVSRDFSNIGNRLAILDQANLDKSMLASKKQIQYIEDYAGRIGWEHVRNPKLNLLMHLRLEHQEASLDDLARMMSEEFASTITKSNVNHLFRFLKQEYEAHHGEDHA